MYDEFDDLDDYELEADAIDWLDYEKKVRDNRRFQPVDEEEDRRVSLFTSLWDEYE